MNPNLPNGIQKELPHAPVDAKTLAASVTKLAGTSTDLSDISEGYDHWRAAFDQGKAGVSNIPLAEILDVIETAVSSGN